MFTRMTDFGLQRTRKQAIGFFLAYSLGMIVAGGVLGGVVGMYMAIVSPGPLHFEQFTGVGIAISALGSAMVTYLVMARKNMPAMYVLAVLAAGVAGGLLGVFVGMIIPAVLSTSAPVERRMLTDRTASNA